MDMLARHHLDSATVLDRVNRQPYTNHALITYAHRPSRRTFSHDPVWKKLPFLVRQKFVPGAGAEKGKKNKVQQVR